MHNSLGNASLQGRTALITGGSTGIGRATTLVLVERGASVVIGYNQSSEAAMTLAKKIASEGGHAIAIKADVTVETEVASLVDEAVRTFGKLDILVNNAGGLIRRCLLPDLPRDAWDATMALNLTAPYLCCRAAVPHLERRTGSAIINVASSSAFTGGSGGSSHYAAAKAGVVALTKGLAFEVAPMGIRVNAVAPGPVDTDFHVKVPHAQPKELWGKKVPLGRPGEPEEIAKAIAFLASDDSSFITGQTLQVSGGMVMM